MRLISRDIVGFGQVSSLWCRRLCISRNM